MFIYFILFILATDVFRDRGLFVTPWIYSSNLWLICDHCGQIQKIGWESNPNSKFIHLLKKETTSTKQWYRSLITDQVTTAYLLRVAGQKQQNMILSPPFRMFTRSFWSRIKMIPDSLISRNIFTILDHLRLPSSISILFFSTSYTPEM